ALAAELVRRRVSVIHAIGVPPSVAAKAATSTIPIVFQIGADPVELGLVASLNRPGGNITGVTSLPGEVNTKRLQLLHEAVPTANVIAAIVNPTEPNGANLARNLEAPRACWGSRSISCPSVLNATSTRSSRPCGITTMCAPPTVPGKMSVRAHS